jgi:hypothetical protein
MIPPPEARALWGEANESFALARIAGHPTGYPRRSALGKLSMGSSSHDLEYNKHDVALESVNGAETS